MVKANFALIAVAILAIVLFVSLLGTGSFGGGTVLSLNQVGFTNDPTIPFTKEYQVNVVLDGSANYLQGATSAPITAPNTSTPFTVNYELDNAKCSYQLQVHPQTLSKLAINSYLPTNSNSAYDALSPPWSTSCRASAIVFTALSNHIYKSYGMDTDVNGQTIYCNDIPSQATDCKQDFKTICENNPGFKSIPCTVPASQLDATFQQIFGLQSGNGRACVKVADRSASADLISYGATSKSFKMNAHVTVTKGGNTETIYLSDNNMSGNTADVYARSSFTVNSYAPACAEYSDLVYIQRADGSSAGASSKSSLNALSGAYSAAKASTTTMNNLDDIKNSVATFNSQMDNAFSGVTASYTDAPGSMAIDRSSNTPQLPWIQLYINAAWLGIVNPVAIPALGAVSPNPVTFTQGNPATVSVPVSNIGAAGALQISLPVCTPAATFTWQTDPNFHTYNDGTPYIGTFLATATQGTYACMINAQTSGFVVGGNYHPTSTSFTMNVAGQCTNSANPPFYRSPTPTDPCRVVCPLDPAIAGSDVCAASGLVYNATTCACQAAPNCVLTNSCPICTSCSDGTGIGICVANQQIKCKLSGQQCVLTPDTTCPGQGGQNQTQCLPIIQKLVPTTVGGILGIGGTTTYTCENDFVGMVFVAIVILVVVSAFGGRKRLFK